jgi:hypothetical protein
MSERKQETRNKKQEKQTTQTTQTQTQTNDSACFRVFCSVLTSRSVFQIRCFQSKNLSLQSGQPLSQRLFPLRSRARRHDLLVCHAAPSTTFKKKKKRKREKNKLMKQKEETKRTTNESSLTKHKMKKVQQTTNKSIIK